jgi:hypothetical protein
VTRPTSFAPLIVAAGVMLTLWGVASTWILSVAGLLVIGLGSACWLKEIPK